MVNFLIYRNNTKNAPKSYITKVNAHSDLTGTLLHVLVSYLQIW